PVLDQLSKDGIRFEHCYSQPICTPSRVKLMTGMYNVRNYAVFGLLEKQQRTFAQILRESGYATGIVGKWQLGKDASLPDHFGFDEHCLWQLLRRPSRYASPGLEINGVEKDFPGGYGPDVVADYACNFIEEHKEGPFMLYYPMIITHCPFEPTPDSADWDPSSKGSKTYKGDAKYFGDMVTYMDKIVGRILKQLEASGVRENTIVLFTGDNGTDTPVVSMMNGRKVVGAKGTTPDAGCRVPFIAHWPGQTPAGKVSQDLVDFSDFLPTLCEAAGAKLPEDRPLDGRSFLPQLKGEKGNPRDWIYVWYARNGGPKGKEFTRNQRYKLYGSGEFYDIKNDVLEKSPLAVAALSEKQSEVKSMLQSALDQYAEARPERFGSWAAREKKAKEEAKAKKEAEKANQKKRKLKANDGNDS
ncbi:MAG: sulfatase-like hydrolase/transferase, partial [Planctomycetota bacterium]